MSELRKVYGRAWRFRRTQNQVEWLVLWQRVGRVQAGQQRELAQRVGQLGLGQRKPPRVNAANRAGGWRLLASWSVSTRAAGRLGDELIAAHRREPRNASWLWAIGRFGARLPLYGPLNAVVSPAVAERWIEALRALRTPAGEAVAAVATSREN